MKDGLQPNGVDFHQVIVNHLFNYLFICFIKTYFILLLDFNTTKELGINIKIPGFTF